MTAGKYVTPEQFDQPAPAPARPVVPGETSIAAQERVVAEITHELGNFFHKLYYWSDYLHDKRAQRTADATATQMLERTIHNLEGFLKRVVEYFHPVQLALGPMAVTELTAGVEGHIREGLNGTPLTVQAAGPLRDATVLVDPGRLSQVMEIIARHLLEHVRPESEVAVALVREDGSTASVRIELAVRDPNPASALFQTAAAGVEWALAQRVIALHGGELTEMEPQGNEWRTALVLPLVP